jgi:phosphomevalonate kinase
MDISLSNNHTCQLMSDQFNEKIMYFTWSNYHDIFENHPYIRKALDISHRVLNESAISLSPFSLMIQSELDHSENKKYGLGSSACLSVGLIQSVCSLHGLRLTPLDLYKLSVLSQFYDFPYSSFGDLACVAFNEWVYYQRFDSSCLIDRQDQSVLERISIPWPNLIIQTLPALNFPILIVYTGQSAQSQHLVKMIGDHQGSSDFLTFSQKSQRIVSDLYARWDQLQSQDLMQSILLLHNNLKQLAQFTQTPLIPSSMLHIEKIIHNHHGMMKFSGAGGGDCVLGIFETSAHLYEAHFELSSQGYDAFIIQKETL